MNIRKILLLSFLMLGSILSCKKKSNNNPPANNKLALIDVAHQGAIEHYRIVYDVYNNVDSIVVVGGGTDTGSNGYEAFNYVGSSFSITDQSGNSFTVDANTNGQILEVLITDTLIMTYTGAELTGLTTKTLSATYPYYSLVSTNYQWANGNIVSATTASTTDSVAYNTAKSGQIGDAFRIDAFLAYGRPYIETTNLPATFTSSGNWVEHCFYQFDSQNRISQFLKVLNNNGAAIDDSTFYNYQYYAD
jgi:hypothetical protein